MSSSKNLSVTVGVFLAVFVLSVVSAQNDLDLSPRQDDLEAADEVQDLLRKVQVLFERKMRNEIQEEELEELEEQQTDKENLNCKCSGLACSCCVFIRIPKFRIAENCCLGLKYIPQRFALQVSFKLGSRTIFRKIISVRHPIPLCVRVPFILPGATICVAFNSLVVTSRYLCGCSKMAAYFFRFPIAKVDLGCFRFNFRNVEQQVDPMGLQFLEDPGVPVENMESVFLGEVPMENIQPAVNVN